MSYTGAGHHFEPDPTESHLSDEEKEIRYHEWLHTRVLHVMNIITRVLGETGAEKASQVRLHRWLRTVLYCIGVRHNAKGVHLGLEDALVLLNPDHPRFNSVYDLVLPLLDQPHCEPMVADLRQLRGISSVTQREALVESSINRLREILSPIVRRIFQPKGTRIDFRKIIASNGIIIASLTCPRV